MEQPYQPEAHADGAPLPVRPTFEEQLHAGLASLSAFTFAKDDRVVVDLPELAHLHGRAGTIVRDGADEYGRARVLLDGDGQDWRAIEVKYLTLDLTTEGATVLAEPVGALTVEPGMRVHPLSDTAGISALRRRVVKL